MQFGAVRIENTVDLEAQIAQQPVDVTRVLARIGQCRQLLVFALSDDQRNTAHRFGRMGGERRCK